MFLEFLDILLHFLDFLGFVDFELKSLVLAITFNERRQELSVLVNIVVGRVQRVSHGFGDIDEELLALHEVFEFYNLFSNALFLFAPEVVKLSHLDHLSMF